MSPPTQPYRPYAAVHQEAVMNGPGDARPTAIQVVKDLKAIGGSVGKTAVITGCSTGLGVETAKALYEAGMTLFLTARDMKRLEGVIDDIVANSATFPPSQTSSSKPPRPAGVEIHLDSLQSVREGAATIISQTPSINFLITNAGVMATPYGLTVDGFETQLGTNHMAHFLLFQLLKPALLTAAKPDSPSRVVTLSSTGHARAGIQFDDMSWTADPAKYDKWVGYSQSKTANIYMASSITRHYGARHLIGLSVHPGGIMTELAKHMDDADMNRIRFDDMTPRMKNLEQGAATTVWATLSPHFDSVANGGRYLCDVGEGWLVEKPLPAGPGYVQHAFDEQSEERLWEISCAAVGVSSRD
nr:short-chain dehydrogenase tic 32, chloroplastic [Quercus suber]